MDRQRDKKRERQTDRWIDSWADRQIDEQLDGQIAGVVDTQMNGYIDRKGQKNRQMGARTAQKKRWIWPWGSFCPRGWTVDWIARKNDGSGLGVSLACRLGVVGCERQAGRLEDACCQEKLNFYEYYLMEN